VTLSSAAAPREVAPGPFVTVVDVSIDPLAALLDIPEVGQVVAQSRTSVDALLANRVLRRRSADVSAESVMRGAWASAVLDGSPASLDEVRAGTAVDLIVQGALRISLELAGLSETWGSAHRQVLARLHALAAADQVPPQELGRPRPDRIVAQRLDVLAEVLAQTSAPAVVISAIVQAEILSLDAFPPSSGVVARAAARLTLISRGLDPKSLVAFEVGHLELADDLARALDAYRTGEPAGVVEWIRHCGSALELGARESMAICEAIQRG
jgi:hypothetical protein